jgi:amino acid transporter
MVLHIMLCIICILFMYLDKVNNFGNCASYVKLHALMNKQKPNPATPHRIGVFTLIMITSALFMTLRNFPMMAETGLQMIFFNLITVFAFLIPIALVSAELATGWPHNGVYFWVKEAFGPKTS